MEKKLPQDHPVFRQIPAFVRHGLAMLERRMRLMGLVDRPLSEIGVASRAATIAQSFGEKAWVSLSSAPKRFFGFGKPTRLTDTYLTDPSIHDRLASSGDTDDVRAEAGSRAATQPAN